VRGEPEGDVERTRASDGKASAVHFFHFRFPPDAVAAWKSGEGQAMLVIDHPNYGHAALISPDTRAFLARECF
jgi:ABC-type sugar transport system substrate-binding protein